MRQVYGADGRVIGAWRYDGQRDVWRCESIHQPGREHIAHSEDDAVVWIRQLHADQQT